MCRGGVAYLGTCNWGSEIESDVESESENRAGEAISILAGLKGGSGKVPGGVTSGDLKGGGRNLYNVSIFKIRRFLLQLRLL